MYFTIPGETLSLADLRTASRQLNQALGEQFENCVCELILSPEDHAPAAAGPPAADTDSGD